MRAVARLFHLLLYSFGLLALVVIAGCAAPGAVSQPIRADVAIHIDRSSDVPPGHIVFKPIPGAMSGKAEDVELFRSAGADRFSIPLDVLLEESSAHAAVARRDASTPAELVTPRDLRMVRIATFFEPDIAVGARECRNFRTGLRAGWPAQATLVYVDRPGSVRGARYVAPYILEYDLAFPAAGLYAIGTVSLGNHVTQSVVDPGSLVARVRPAPCAGSVSRQAAR